MRRRFLNKTPPLSPPASEPELAWWKTKRGKIGLKFGLIQAVPFAVVFVIVDLLRGRSGLHAFGLIPSLAALMGVISWLAVEKHLRSQHIRWKRVREDLGLPSELP